MLISHSAWNWLPWYLLLGNVKSSVFISCWFFEAGGNLFLNLHILSKMGSNNMMASKNMLCTVVPTSEFCITVTCDYYGRRNLQFAMNIVAYSVYARPCFMH